MPMTKREQKMVDDLREALARSNALRWSQPAGPRASLPPDVPAPDPNTADLPKVTHGWGFNAYTRQVYKAFSTFNAHGEGWPEDVDYRTSASQGAVALYSTERGALAALRLAIEIVAARQLVEIDRRIAEIAAEDRAKAILLTGGSGAPTPPTTLEEE